MLKSDINTELCGRSHLKGVIWKNESDVSK
jgi:hypothetical protein